MKLYYIFITLLPSLIFSINPTAISAPIVSTGINIPLGQAPQSIYEKRNLRVSPLEPITPISLGENKAEENPLISEPNRKMIKDYNEGKNNFQEQPIIVNNKINTAILRQIPDTPAPATSQTVVSLPTTNTGAQTIIVE